MGWEGYIGYCRGLNSWNEVFGVYYTISIIRNPKIVLVMILRLYIFGFCKRVAELSSPGIVVFTIGP